MDKNEKLKRLLKERVSPCLKKHGFRKNRLVYRRELGDYSWIIDVEKGRFNPPDVIDFQMNWGIDVSRAWKGLYPDIIDSPNAYAASGCISDTFDRLVGGAGRQVLKPDDPENYELEVGDTLVQSIEEVVLPFLKQFKGLRDIADFISDESTETFGTKQYIFPPRSKRLALAAVMYHELGDMKRAWETIEESLALNTAFYKTVMKEPSDGSIESLKERLFPS